MGEHPQFFHEETYGEKSNGKKKTARGVIAEFKRDHWASGHVPVPIPQEPLFSGPEGLLGVLPLIRERKRQILNETGRRVRVDAQVLLGAVFGYKTPLAELVRMTPKEWEPFGDWVAGTASWARETYGPECIVGAHIDEGRYHLHAVAPAFVEDGKLTLGAMHAGQHAGKAAVRQAIEANGGSADGLNTKLLYNEAYKAAEKARQDDYFAKVAGPCGMDRKSTKPRRRYSREQALDKKKIAELEAKLAAALAHISRVNGFLEAAGIQVTELDLEAATVAPPLRYGSATVAKLTGPL